MTGSWVHAAASGALAALVAGLGTALAATGVRGACRWHRRRRAFRAEWDAPPVSFTGISEADKAQFKAETRSLRRELAWAARQQTGTGGEER